MQREGAPPPHRALSYLTPRPPLKGQSLYLGGTCGPDGTIYCIPGHATRVLAINPDNDECLQIGPEFDGKFKWLRAITASNGVIYGLPCNADSVLRIDATTNRSSGTSPQVVDVSTIPIPFDTFFADDANERESERSMPWKYHGGAISPADGCIYCIPQSATRVLRIDPNTDECTFVGPKLEGKYKWYGGVLSDLDGAIYGIPHNSGTVLRIRPVPADLAGASVTLHGDLGTCSHQWHGASVSSDGTIVCIPANASTVLLIRPPLLPHTGTNDADDDGGIPTLRIIGGADVIATGSNAGRGDRKYKYLGAVPDRDCNVYCLPSGAERVLCVNTATETVLEIGPSLYDSGMERMKQNKWQNGFYSDVDGCIYGIPLAAETVLKIDTKEMDGSGRPTVSTLGLPSEPFGGLAKWEGGVMTENGIMYCMPNNFKKVLRIEPGVDG